MIPRHSRSRRTSFDIACIGFPTIFDIDAVGGTFGAFNATNFGSCIAVDAFNISIDIHVAWSFDIGLAFRTLGIIRRLSGDFCAFFCCHGFPRMKRATKMQSGVDWICGSCRDKIPLKLFCAFYRNIIFRKEFAFDQLEQNMNDLDVHFLYAVGISATWATDTDVT